jgi:hypothetical protein
VRLCKTFLRISHVGVETAECIIKSRIRQPVLTAERNVKFLSSQTEAGQCTAENATPNEDHHEGIRLIS